MCDQVVQPNFKGYILRKYAPPKKSEANRKKTKQLVGELSLWINLYKTRENVLK